MRVKKVPGQVGDMVKCTMALAEAEALIAATDGAGLQSVQVIRDQLKACLAGPVELPKPRT